MQSNYNIELGTVTAMGPESYPGENGMATLQNGAAQAAAQGLSVSVVAEDGELNSSSSHKAPSPAIPGGNSAAEAHPTAILQPALVRSASTQPSQILAVNNNRSMSDLINNSTDNGTQEYGGAGEYRDRMRSSAMQHYRAGRYQEALEGFMSRQRMYISIVTFVVMFGMTVAGLWLEIAGSH